MPVVLRRSVLASLLAASLGLPAVAAAPRDTLVQAMAIDDIITMDPAESFELGGGEILGNTYERLLKFDVADPSLLSGALAKSWTVSADGRTFSFELQPGLKFASGNPLTAEDAVFSLQRAITLNKTPAFILSQFGWTAANVAERVRQTGPLTLTISTDKAYAPSFVLNCLSANVASVLDKKLLLANAQGNDLGNGWLKTHHAGSGPWRLREWRANEILVLERNDNFHGAKPALARAIYRHVKEAATQRLLLEKGDIDVARNLAPQDLAALAQNKDIKTSSVAKGTVYYISLNQKNPQLAKPEVREAFKWLVDYDAIGATLIKDIGVVNQNFLPQGLLGAASDKPYKLDVAKARSLLAKAGLPNGFKITMDVRTVQPVQGIAEAVQATVKRAGIEIEIIPGDGKQTLSKYRARKHDLYIGEWGADYWDPHTNADTFARNPDNGDDAQLKPLAWRNAWAIPELTRKSDAALLDRDTAKRAKLYQDIQAEFRKTSPFVMIYQQQQVAAVRANVDGFRLGPTADSTYVAPVSKR
ncbi:MAG: ABC transporter substrate-binding protein [Burkholderiaceae bacterium]